MAVEGLDFSVEDGIATITFNRPEKLNAVTEAMRTEVHRIATELRNDDDVKVLVFTGAGEAFSTGADAGELTADYSGPIEPYILKRPLGWWALPVRYFPKPTIAAIPGITAGTTFSLALACDFGEGPVQHDIRQEGARPRQRGHLLPAPHDRHLQGARADDDG